MKTLKKFLKPVTVQDYSELDLINYIFLLRHVANDTIIQKESASCLIRFITFSQFRM